MAPTDTIFNALSIDVEDYFQVSAFESYVSRNEWDTYLCRVERNVENILGILEHANAKATFFTLGWVAERYPGLVRRIVDCGHELASHGYSHRRASDQTPEDFFADISDAKKLLEDVSGERVLGYRAPSFSIGRGNEWALESIAKAGYQYSSSVYPVQHDHYGWVDAPRFPFQPCHDLIEIPVSTVHFWNRNWPAGGGGYFRLLPYWLSRWAIRRINTFEGKPAIFYFHPWELDPDQPKIGKIGPKARFRHYVNLSRTEARLKRLVTDFSWQRVDQVYLEGINGTRDCQSRVDSLRRMG